MVILVGTSDNQQKKANGNIVIGKRKVLDIKSGTCKCSPEKFYSGQILEKSSPIENFISKVLMIL